MAIEQINGQDATLGMNRLTGQNSMGKDEFLTLLVAQLQHQDPLKPMDSTDFTAQLAQFSSLEQLSNMNGKLDTLTLSQVAFNNTQAVSYIGREILAEGSLLRFDGTNPAGCVFELAEAAQGVFVNVYDQTGRFIRTFEAGALESGTQNASWDGRDQDGNLMPTGDYFFEVSAVDAENAAVQATALTRGTVTGVTYRNGRAYLAAAGREISIDEVRRVLSAGE
ncbi:MAG: flagellar hook assembly protein FlgD [Desulfobacterales bacterium]